MTATERAIADALADGRMTDDDAEAVRTFAEFLEIAASPRPGRSPLQKCLDAGRKDLIAFALGCGEDEVDQRIAEMKVRTNDGR